ncbi:unnamed protein product [Darwinula stevensoni]|uniref:Ig-like domain-containing protein n=1 Tax=Darwinula stevensoni TaxID=69355 RepID=A0A7R9A967_9CRUS|nr:unnamed protein product [Darwinula stevensoni]CAG0897063.1 unnamed protein product [Darwinula stevensoni]
MEAPRFVLEPPSTLSFTNSSGAELSCIATGSPSPRLRWLGRDGHPVLGIPGILKVLENGTMLLHPFSAEQFRAEIHRGTFQCSASNPAGTVLSRETRLRAVVHHPYEVRVGDESVTVGNTAVFRCLLPSYVEDDVTVTSWFLGSKHNIYPQEEGGGEKYHMLPSGELLIHEVTKEDNGTWVGCRTASKLEGHSVSASTMARLLVREEARPIPPRLVHLPRQVEARKDSSCLLTCVAHGNPPPQASVRRKLGNSVWDVPVRDGLLVKRVEEADSTPNAFECVARNRHGEARQSLTIGVRAPLSAHVQPRMPVVDLREKATLVCGVVGMPTPEIHWVKDGRAVGRATGREDGGQRLLMDDGGQRLQVEDGGRRLVVPRMREEDAGVYQCFLSNDWDSAQDSVQLVLGGKAFMRVMKF